MVLSHRDIEAALQAARAASTAILEVYRQPFDVDFKAGEEPVTRADRQADRIIIDVLAGAFPDDAFLTEENGFTPAASGRAGPRVWFVDPIDGTKEFIKKNGEFAVQIGLAENGRLTAGLLLRPVTGEVFAAVRGLGCVSLTPDGRTQKVQIPPVHPPWILALSRSHPSRLAQDLRQTLGPMEAFRCGSVGLKLMAIACGQAHFYLNDSNSTKAWDIAAPQILFEEAGGVVTDLSGHPFTYDPADPYHRHGLLASGDPELHRTILNALATNRQNPSE